MPYLIFSSALPVLHVFLPLFTVVLLPLAAVLSAIAIRPRISFRRPVFYIIIFLVGYGALSGLWSVDPGRTLERAARLVVEVVSITILAQALFQAEYDVLLKLWRPTAMAYTAAGVLITIDLIFNGLLSSFSHGGIFQNFHNRGISILLLVGPFIMAVAWTRDEKLFAGTIAAILVCLGVFTHTATPIFVLGLAAIVGGLVAFWPSSRFVFAMLLLALFLAGPWLFGSILNYPIFCDLIQMDDSLYHRGAIWSFVAERIAERPILGWGLDASRAVPGADISIMHSACPHPDRWDGRYAASLPLHPHNAALHIWLELGVIGILCVGTILSIILTKAVALATTPASRFGVVATTTAYLTIALMSFGVWQGWWIGSAGLVIALCIMGLRMLDQDRSVESRG